MWEAISCQSTSLQSVVVSYNKRASTCHQKLLAYLPYFAIALQSSASSSLVQRLDGFLFSAITAHLYVDRELPVITPWFMLRSKLVEHWDERTLRFLLQPNLSDQLRGGWCIVSFRKVEINVRYAWSLGTLDPASTTHPAFRFRALVFRAAKPLVACRYFCTTKILPRLGLNYVVRLVRSRRPRSMSTKICTVCLY